MHGPHIGLSIGQHVGKEHGPSPFWLHAALDRFKAGWTARVGQVAKNRHESSLDQDIFRRHFDPMLVLYIIARVVMEAKELARQVADQLQAFDVASGVASQQGGSLLFHFGNGFIVLMVKAQKGTGAVILVEERLVARVVAVAVVDKTRLKLVLGNGGVEIVQFGRVQKVVNDINVGLRVYKL